MEFQKISSPSLRDLFIEQLEHLILSGKLQVGEKLPPERQLAEMMQVSRAVVNSGISELEKKGFLTVKPRSGTYVADFRRKGTLDTLIAIMNYNGGRMRDQEIRSIFEVRIALDTLDAQDVTTAIEAAYEFQHEFALISGNTLIPLIFQSFRAPIFNMWERYCELYGIEELYRSNYKTWTYIRDRDTQGAIEWIQESMQDCIDGKHQIYYSNEFV